MSFFILIKKAKGETKMIEEQFKTSPDLEKAKQKKVFYWWNSS